MKKLYKCGVMVALALSMLITGGAQAKEKKKIVNCNQKKYSYSEMKEDIELLAERYPEYCSYEVIGVTRKGRNIYDLVIGNPDASKSMLVVSTLHAREYVCSATTMRIAEYYLQNYNKKISGVKPSSVFDKVQLHMVVMANPDGVMISQTKNASWKANSRGVDLNRNFPYYFRARGTKGSEEYSGKKAASERETQAIIGLTKRLKYQNGLCAQINYHAMGQIIFGDYGGKSKKMRKKITKMYKIAQDETGYSDSSGYSAPSNGNYREYVMYKMKVPSITIELGMTPCPVAYFEYNRIFEKNKNVILRIGKEYK